MSEDRAARPTSPSEAALFMAGVYPWAQIETGQLLCMPDFDGTPVTPSWLRGVAETLVQMGAYAEGSEIVCWLRHVAQVVEDAASLNRVGKDR